MTKEEILNETTFEEVLEERKSTNIYAKLLKVKSEIGTLTKKADNPFFKSKYLDLSDLLEAVEQVLEKYLLVLTQPIIDNQVVTVLTDIETEKHIESSMPLTPSANPQQMGSQISYYRRYTLASLLAIAQVDDDGNQASKAPKVLDADRFDSALVAIESGKYTVAQLRNEWSLTADQEEALKSFTNGK